MTETRYDRLLHIGFFSDDSCSKRAGSPESAARDLWVLDRRIGAVVAGPLMTRCDNTPYAFGEAPRQGIRWQTVQR